MICSAVPKNSGTSVSVLVYTPASPAGISFGAPSSTGVPPPLASKSKLGSHSFCITGIKPV
jgi:hypothetical protein